MDKLCQFSTIIFAGNVSVLLIVAVTTDYWEYRDFKLKEIANNITNKPTKNAFLETPSDTDSHLILRYYWGASQRKGLHLPDCCRLEMFSEPPAVLQRYYYAGDVTVNATRSDGASNVTSLTSRRGARIYESVVILFRQYGNLFRDCDNLEHAVRQRLNLSSKLPRRCHNFVSKSRLDNYIESHIPAVIYIELAAFGFAVVCIVASLVSFGSGAYGSMMRDRVAILTASSSALGSGVSLTIAIALFHSKCQLLHQQRFMAGLDIGPYKKTVDDGRQRRYGWSFCLAWICVALCFIHSIAWLHNAQELEEPNLPSCRDVHRRRYRGLQSDESCDDGDLMD